MIVVLLRKTLLACAYSRRTPQPSRALETMSSQPSQRRSLCAPLSLGGFTGRMLGVVVSRVFLALCSQQLSQPAGQRPASPVPSSEPKMRHNYSNGMYVLYIFFFFFIYKIYSCSGHADGYVVRRKQAGVLSQQLGEALHPTDFQDLACSRCRARKLCPPSYFFASPRA